MTKPYQRLACAIVIRAFRDLVADDRIQALDALCWLVNSPDAEFIFESIGLRKHPVDLIISGAYPRRFPTIIAKDFDEFDFGEDLEHDRTASNDKLG